ncbi:MAG: hypothetical protein JSV09_13415 [Thermoplasmata archaeon]|nr:MAG: hypothetical protein JSV09_13415 [Thermoplasmata archaeon]
MKKIALGETLPIEITEVSKLEGRDKYKIIFRDDDGFEGMVYLDVELPIGTAELKLVHKEG